MISRAQKVVTETNCIKNALNTKPKMRQPMTTPTPTPIQLSLKRY
ncbi:hypothetical protein [Helicobacter acinonychis]